MTAQNDHLNCNWNAWRNADLAWQAELEKVFGPKAADYRYDRSKHASTPELARLKAEVLRLREEWNRLGVSRVEFGPQKGN